MATTFEKITSLAYADLLTPERLAKLLNYDLDDLQDVVFNYQEMSNGRNCEVQHTARLAMAWVIDNRLS